MSDYPIILVNVLAKILTNSQMQKQKEWLRVTPVVAGLLVHIMTSSLASFISEL